AMRRSILEGSVLAQTVATRFSEELIGVWHQYCVAFCDVLAEATLTKRKLIAKLHCNWHQKS
ncbi:MAG: hypothetical protein VW519_09870, partial [Luminiphilus sp.]